MCSDRRRKTSAFILSGRGMKPKQLAMMTFPTKALWNDYKNGFTPISTTPSKSTAPISATTKALVFFFCLPEAFGVGAGQYKTMLVGFVHLFEFTSPFYYLTYLSTLGHTSMCHFAHVRYHSIYSYALSI